MDNIINVYFKSHKTLIEMLIDRKVISDDENSLNIDYTQFSSKFNNNELSFFLHDEDENKEDIYIYYSTSIKNFGKNDLKNAHKTALTKLSKDKYKIFIIVYDKITSSISKELQITYKNVELLTTKFLSFNITKHTLVPKHDKLSDEDVIKLLNYYNITKVQMPKINITDPVIRYYNMKIGDVCKITRFNNTSGESIYYRVVK